MISIAIQLAILGAIYLYQRYLAPKPEIENAKPAKFGDLTFPRATEGAPLPIFWGVVKFNAPNVIWAANYVAQPVTEDIQGQDVIVGYHYGLIMQMILGIPPDDEVGPPFLTRMWYGDILAWGGGRMEESPAPNKINIKIGDALAGKQNRLYGDVLWMPGTKTQTQQEDIVDAFDRESGFVGSLLPAFRGQSVVTLCNFYGGHTDPTLDTPAGEYPVGSMSFGFSPNIKPIAIEVKAFARTSVLGSYIGAIGHGDANPAVVLYDILTSNWGKLGFSDTDIDKPSFLAAAQRLHLEQNGFSMIVYNPNSAKTLIDEIRQQIDAEIFQDMSTGKIKMKLIRDDYDVGTIPAFDVTNVIEILDYSRTTWSELYNRVNVVYTDYDKKYTERTAFAQNEAAIAANNGVVRSFTYQFRGVTNGFLASKIANRQLNALSTPLTRIKFSVNREAYNVKPGDVVKLSWPDFGIVNLIVRVKKISLGDLHDGRIVIEGLEDRFAVNHTVTELPPWDGTIHIPQPSPIREWFIDEAPRLMQQFAYNEGLLNNVDVQHVMYLAVPELNNNAYVGRIAVNSNIISTDTQQLQFSMRSKVVTAYPRTTSAYDTTTHLIVDKSTITVSELDTATSTEIRNEGKNWILVGTELMAYESYTDLGATIRLNNVWRGLCDTVPQDHAVDVRVYFLKQPWLGGLGQATVLAGKIVEARVLPRANFLFLSDDEQESEVFVGSLRVLAPYPPSDLKLNTSKTPSPIEEEGVTVDWKKRERTLSTLARGDDANDTIVDTTYTIMARKADATSWTTIIGSLNVDTYSNLALAQFGYGDMEIGVRGYRTVSGSPKASWQDPALDIHAYHWRNLVLNPRFAGGSGSFWEVTSGSYVVVSDATSLGGTGYYVKRFSAGANIDINQVVNITGYLPERLQAIVEAVARNTNLDTDDTIRMDLIALDVNDNVLQTSTYGPTAQSLTLWQRITAQSSALPANTAKLKVRFLLSGVTGSGDDGTLLSPDSIFTEVVLRVGQFSAELLTNGNFSGGALTGWTQTTGTWQILTTTKYIDTNYVRPNDGASAELSQTVSVPTGFQYGTAILECARMNDAVDDTGQVVLEALAAGVVVASSSTSSEAITPINTWARRRVKLTVPANADQLRVRALATRVSGTPLNSCFDDFSLRIFKELSSTNTAINFNDPPVQTLPQTTAEWAVQFPDIATPDYGFWDGKNLDGRLSTEPSMETGDPSTGASSLVVYGIGQETKFVGLYNGTDFLTDCYDFLYSDEPEADIHTMSNVYYGNFSSADPFTVFVALRYLRPQGAVSVDTCDIIGRMGATGWKLSITEDGFINATLSGTTPFQISSNEAYTDGAPAFAALIYDPDTEEMHLVTPGGVVTTSVAGIGEIRCDELQSFRIGRAEATQFVFPGQIARVYMWKQALTTSEIQSMWVHHTDENNLFSTHTRDSAVAVVIDSDANGPIVGRYTRNQIAYVKNSELTSNGENGIAILKHRTITNLAPSWLFTDTVYWVPDVGVAAFFPDANGVERSRHAAFVLQGDSTHGVKLQSIPAKGGPGILVKWFAKGASAGTARLVLESSAGVVKETHDYAVTTVWQEFSHRFTSWDQATSFCQLHFYASNSASVQILTVSAPILVTQVPWDPFVYPCAGGHTVEPLEMVLDLTTNPIPGQFNFEGEIEVEGLCKEANPLFGTILSTNQGSTNHDRHDIRISGNGRPIFEHYDGAGTKKTAAGAAVTWNDPWSIRARWASVGLLNHDTTYAGMFGGAYPLSTTWQTYARHTQFTADTEVQNALHVGRNGASANGEGVPDDVEALIRRIEFRAREEKLQNLGTTGVKHSWDFTKPESIFYKPQRIEDFARWTGVSGVVQPTAYFKMENEGSICVDEDGFRNLTNNANSLKWRRMQGLWDGLAWDNIRGMEFPNTNVPSVSSSTADFDAGSQSFGGFFIFRSPGKISTQTGVMGKSAGVGTAGWRIYMTNGLLSLRVEDSTTNVQRNLVENYADGAWHYCVFWINRTTDQVRIYTDLEKVVSSSIAGLGNFTNSANFRLGSDHSGNSCTPMQIAMSAFWFGGVAGLDDTSGWDSLWARLISKKISGMDYSRTGMVGVPINPGSVDGERLRICGPNEITYSYDAAFTHTSKIGLRGVPSVQNLLTNADINQSSWATNGSITKTTNIGAANASDYDDPTGNRWAVQLSKSAANACIRDSVSLTNAIKYTFSVWLKVTNTSYVPVIRIRDNADTTTKASTTCSGMVAGKWQRFSVTWTADATASFRFEIHPDNPANASGICWAAYAQVDRASVARPFAYSQGSSFTTTVPTCTTHAKVSANDQCRIDYTYVYDGSDVDGTVLGFGPYPNANSRLVTAEAGTTTKHVLFNNSGALVGAHFLTTAVNDERVNSFQWIDDGSAGNCMQSMNDGSGPTSTAGTFTSDGNRIEMVLFKCGSATQSTGGCIAKIDITENYI